MRTVNIGIRHNDYFSVAEFFNIKILADRRTESSHNGHKLFVCIYLVYARFFNIEHFTPERKYRLIAAVTPLFCRTARGISLDDVKLSLCDIMLIAVGKLSRQGSAVHSGLAAGCLTGFFRRFARFLSVH